MDAITNSFCAGGTVLGNGTWLNVGGNQAVKEGGEQADSQNGGGIYDDPDGGRSYVLTSCACNFRSLLTTRRRSQCSVIIVRLHCRIVL